MNETIRRTIPMLFPFALAITGLTGCDVEPKDPADGQAISAIDEDDHDCPDAVPAALTPAADQTLMHILDASGVQIYSCNATATGYAWTFVAPSANLFDEDGEQVGTHYAGPTWEANDGSTVVGAKQAAVTVDPTAIPWLLLTAKSHNAVVGHFTDVTSIQRLETTGGNAPATGCDAANAGAIAQVPYTARYAMYKTKDHGRVHQCAQ